MTALPELNHIHKSMIKSIEVSPLFIHNERYIRSLERYIQNSIQGIIYRIENINDDNEVEDIIIDMRKLFSNNRLANLPCLIFIRKDINNNHTNKYGEVGNSHHDSTYHTIDKHIEYNHNHHDHKHHDKILNDYVSSTVVVSDNISIINEEHVIRRLRLDTYLNSRPMKIQFIRFEEDSKGKDDDLNVLEESCVLEGLEWLHQAIYPSKVKNQCHEFKSSLLTSQSSSPSSSLSSNMSSPLIVPPLILCGDDTNTLSNHDTICIMRCFSDSESDCTDDYGDDNDDYKIDDNESGYHDDDNNLNTNSIITDNMMHIFNDVHKDIGNIDSYNYITNNDLAHVCNDGYDNSNGDYWRDSCTTHESLSIASLPNSQMLVTNNNNNNDSDDYHDDYNNDNKGNDDSNYLDSTRSSLTTVDH